MIKNFKNFKGKHSLKFELDTRPAPTLLRDLAVGDIFLREGAICMRVQDTVCDKGFQDQVKHENKIVIINLQTANVWASEGDKEIQRLDAKVVVTKNHDNALF